MIRGRFCTKHYSQRRTNEKREQNVDMKISGIGRETNSKRNRFLNFSWFNRARSDVSGSS